MADPAPSTAPPDLAGRVLHRDRFLLVIDKPAGLAVHPGPATRESLEDLLPVLAFDRREPPMPAHRLDRDTSGCLALGRTRGALKRLQAAFAAGRVGKTYWAVAVGRPPAETGRVDRPLAKVSSKAAGWRMVADPALPGAKPAATRWRVLEARGGMALVELTPETGRTHQLRAHLAWLGCPILGDPVYGGDPAPRGRLMLHARRLTIPAAVADPEAPAGAPPITVEAPVPEGFPLQARGGAARGEDRN